MIAPFLLALILATASQDPAVTAVPPAARFFAVEFRTGPRWESGKPANEQTHFAEHSQNLQSLRKEGRILLGGRYSDRGFLVLSGASEDEVRKLFESDPSVAGGVFVFDVWEFRPFYPGCVGTAK